MTQINAYDDYGIPQGKTPAGALITNGTGLATANFGRFGYTGQAWLPEIGLNYYKARMYSPPLGRFMQTDPIGYSDGVNLYAYVGGDPINGRDPSGLATTGNAQEEDELTEQPIVVTGRKEKGGGGGDTIDLRSLFDNISGSFPFGNGRQEGVGRLDQAPEEMTPEPGEEVCDAMCEAEKDKKRKDLQRMIRERQKEIDRLNNKICALSVLSGVIESFSFTDSPENLLSTAGPALADAFVVAKQTSLVDIRFSRFINFPISKVATRVGVGITAIIGGAKGFRNTSQC